MKKMAKDFLDHRKVFRTINGKPIRWQFENIIHDVEGFDVNGERILWTRCERSVPKNALITSLGVNSVSLDKP